MESSERVVGAREGSGRVAPDDGIDLVSRLQSGDEEAWSVAYTELHRPLLGYLRFRGAQEPEDALSEVFLRLARRIRSFRGTFEDLGRYAYVIAGNLLRDEARRRSRRPDTSTALEDFHVHRYADASAEEGALKSGRYGDLLDRIAALTHEQQHVLYLRVVADLPIREVARMVHRTPGAVKMLQQRAMAALRSELDSRPPRQEVGDE